MAMKLNFVLNSEIVSEEINPSLTVLDYLRNIKKLTGTKEGCREGDCGACTIIVGTMVKNKINYKTVNSCLMPVADLDGKHIVTIEGLNSGRSSIIQRNMVEEGGTQCGFCTPGFIMSITNYFLNNSNYSVDEAMDALDGNICRCTGYEGIKRSLKKTTEQLGGKDIKEKTKIKDLVNAGLLPDYFLSVHKKNKSLKSKNYSERITKKNQRNLIKVAGGTDLYVQKWEQLYDSDINFISADEDNSHIIKIDNKIHISGSATIEQFRNSKLINKYYPSINNDLKLFGSLPIRNRATIAGNIVNASPIADMVNILLALNAAVVLSIENKKRKLPLKDFYTGYKQTVLKKGEIVKSVEIKIQPRNFLFNYEKVSRRTHLDIASVNSSIYLEISGDKILKTFISAGGVAPTPILLNKTNSFLSGSELSIGTLKEAAEIAQSEISPISDARGSDKYKSILLRQLIYAHFIKLFPDLINGVDLP